MLRHVRIFILIITGLLPFSFACIPVLPPNTEAEPAFARSAVLQDLRLTYHTEAGLLDGHWVDLVRSDGSGTIGGYLSTASHTRDALVILLHGASTGHQEGAVGSAREFHEQAGKVMRSMGFRTFAPAVQECGTAYGEGDLTDIVEIIDWLDAGGRETLRVNRVYILGYSVGATLATLTNRERMVTGVVSLAGLASPEFLEAQWPLLNLIGNLYPLNEGMCQLRTTLRTYGQPGNPAWDVLDSVAAMDELQSPMLLVHGLRDGILPVDSVLALEQRYLERVAEGAILPQLDFMFIPNGDHGTVMTSDAVVERIVDFFNRFEPAPIAWAPDAD